MRLLLLAISSALAVGACETSDRAAATVEQSLIGHAESAGVHLVREYVRRDFLGERLRFNPWFLNVVVWPEEPAYDGYTLVTDYTVEVLSSDSSTARVRVQYDRVGFVRSTQRAVRFDSDSAKEARVFTVALTDNGWRVVAPQMDQHVGLESALQVSPFDDSQRRLLSAMLGRPGPR
jgi:hypothetical protein